MRARINVGIRSNGNPRFLSRVARNAVNQLQLCTGLHIEEENIGVKRISNFIGRFADPRKDYFFGRTARAQNSERSEEHTSELQSLAYLVCRLLLEKKQ